MIREATLDDRAQFSRLYMEFLKDQREQGSYILPSVANLARSRNMYEVYTTGTADGVCLLWYPSDAEEPAAVLLAGTHLPPFDWDTSLGRVAQLWGVYVEPRHRGKGITMKLFERAMEIGLGQGYATIQTHVLCGNSHGERVAREFGTRPHLEEHYIELGTAMTSPEARAGLAREDG